MQIDNFIRIVAESRLEELRGIDAIRKPDEVPHTAPFQISMRRSHKIKTLVSVLKSHGFTAIRHDGAYSHIFQHPGLNYIIKIFSEDPCYMKFVDLVRQHQDNPHFPRIFGKGYLKLPGDNVFGIRIEKLTPRGYNPILYKIQDYIRGDTGRDAELRRKIIAEYGRKFAATIDMVKETLKNNRPSCRNDLHDENIMMRWDIPVIIDPFAPQ